MANDKFTVVDVFLTNTYGYQLYNISRFTFDFMFASLENINQNRWALLCLMAR